jgi:putative oxidoreductase
MKTAQNLSNLFGRLLIVALFLPAGLSKLMNFEGTLGYFNSLGMPAPSLALVIAIVVEILGAIALILGFQTGLVAIVLAIFTFAATLLGHAFWAVPAEQAFVTQLLFFKNIAVIGGLFVLAANGAGKFSIDGRKELN